MLRVRLIILISFVFFAGKNWLPLPTRFVFCVGKCCRGQLKYDGTRAETRFCLSAKRTSPFKSAGESVQSTTGSRGVRISDSNAGYNMFRGSVKGTGYPIHSPVSPSLPLPASPCAITFQLESNSVNLVQSTVAAYTKLRSEVCQTQLLLCCRKLHFLNQRTAIKTPEYYFSFPRPTRYYCCYSLIFMVPCIMYQFL